MFATFDSGTSGLANVGYEVRDSDGTVYQARTTTGVAELGSSGIYGVEELLGTLSGRTIVWDTGEAIPQYGAETFAAFVVVEDGAATGGPADPTVPGDRYLVRGDDYLAADGRALDWFDTRWPDLTGATVTVRTGSFEKAMTVPAAGISLQQVRLELTTADTLTFGATTRDYQVLAVLASGGRSTLARGRFVIHPDVR